MKITRINTLVEALRTGRPLNRILISRDVTDSRLEKVKNLCGEKKVLYKFVPKSAIDRKAQGPHQGVFAEVAPVSFLPLEEVAEARPGAMLVILYDIQDPHNLGAIIRSAVCAGVEGVVISQKRSAPLNNTVLDVSEGTLLRARIVYSRQFFQDVKKLKKMGFWLIAADREGGKDYCDYDFTMPTALVMGNENKGISPNLKKLTDQSLRIPIARDTDSLNVSVSCGILLFEARRQKRQLFHDG